MSADQISKAQERETLEQIMDLIQGIGGDDSYVGMAMKGVYEVAISNIENDFADNLADRACNAENSAEKYMKQCEGLVIAIEKSKAEAVEAKQLQKEAQEAVAILQKELHKLREGSAAAIQSLRAAQIQAGSLELELRSAKQEIIELKAKLYDLMTKE